MCIKLKLDSFVFRKKLIVNKSYGLYFLQPSGLSWALHVCPYFRDCCSGSREDSVESNTTQSESSQIQTDQDDGKEAALSRAHPVYT